VCRRSHYWDASRSGVSRGLLRQSQHRNAATPRHDIQCQAEKLSLPFVLPRSVFPHYRSSGYSGFLNETTNPRPVDVTASYEHISNVPHHLSTVTPVWLDVMGICGGSDYPIPNNTMILSPSKTPPWTANITGHITFVAGHIHDGGIQSKFSRPATPSASMYSSKHFFLSRSNILTIA
jgi:hypothetical protein